MDLGGWARFEALLEVAEHESLRLEVSKKVSPTAANDSTSRFVCSRFPRGERLGICWENKMADIPSESSSVNSESHLDGLILISKGKQRDGYVEDEVESRPYKVMMKVQPSFQNKVGAEEDGAESRPNKPSSLVGFEGDGESRPNKVIKVQPSSLVGIEGDGESRPNKVIKLPPLPPLPPSSLVVGIEGDGAVSRPNKLLKLQPSPKDGKDEGEYGPNKGMKLQSPNVKECETSSNAINPNEVMRLQPSYGVSYRRNKRKRSQPSSTASSSNVSIPPPNEKLQPSSIPLSVPPPVEETKLQPSFNASIPPPSEVSKLQSSFDVSIPPPPSEVAKLQPSFDVSIPPCPHKVKRLQPSSNPSTNKVMKLQLQPSSTIDDMFKNKIRELGGSESSLTLVFRKVLTHTDVSHHQNRLLIPFTLVEHHSFLTKEERQVLETSKSGVGSFVKIPAILIDTACNLYHMNLAKWHMHKGNPYYCLQKQWSLVVKQNHLRPGDMVHIWGFRTQSHLGFVLNVINVA